MCDILTPFAQVNDERIALRTCERVADALGFLPSDFFDDPKAIRELADALEMLRLWAALGDGSGRERVLACAQAILTSQGRHPANGNLSSVRAAGLILTPPLGLRGRVRG